MSSQTPPATFRTGIGPSEADSIMLLGHDLATELLGKTSFGELAYWLIANRRLTDGERVMFEAVLVALADHGFTPTARDPGHAAEAPSRSKEPCGRTARRRITVPR